MSFHTPRAQTITRLLTSWVAIAILTPFLSPPGILTAEEISSRYQAPYPVAASKKGLQVEIIDDALALGVKHATFNVNLSQLILPTPSADAPRWESEGRTYHFRQGYLARLDDQIRSLSSQNVLVNLIILVYASGNAKVDEIMLHPQYDPQAPNRLSAFNIKTDEGRRWLTAIMEFLAERYSRPDEGFGRVVGYIIGNEVNSHWWWSNMGPQTMEGFADEYVDVMRLSHDAVRRQSSWARVYLSLDHHWNIRYAAGTANQAFPSKAFIDYFAKAAREKGDFEWHVAFHPYPENLFEPRFWNDRTATDDAETDRITFKNLEVLTNYMRRPELQYRESPRRIILSEQGFHTPDGPEGEAIQAAAYCLAYRNVDQLDGIDAFILHRHVDHPHEGGLRLGLRRFQPGSDDPRPKKMIYRCFQAADTADWQEAFEFALPIVGRSDW